MSDAEKMLEFLKNCSDLFFQIQYEVIEHLSEAKLTKQKLDRANKYIEHLKNQNFMATKLSQLSINNQEGLSDTAVKTERSMHSKQTDDTYDDLML